MNTDQKLQEVIFKYELLIRQHIREELDSMPEEHMRIMKLVPYQTEIPDNAHHIDIHIRSFADHLASQLQSGSEARKQAMGKLKQLGIHSLDQDSPSQVRENIEQQLKVCSMRKLRDAGVFGDDLTQVEAKYNMNCCLDETYTAVVRELARKVNE